LLPCGQTVNMEYYLKVMKRHNEAGRRKKVWYVEGKKWLLHYNNTTAHSSLLIPIFSQNMRWRSSPSLRTHQILQQWTSFSAPSWNPYWMADNLCLFRTVRKICWQSYAGFQMRHSMNASKTWSNTGSYE
jgi:hypothetical protein